MEVVALSSWHSPPSRSPTNVCPPFSCTHFVVVVMQRYRVLSKIGEGTYGVVLRCVHKASNLCVAIKQFKETDENERVSR